MRAVALICTLLLVSVLAHKCRADASKAVTPEQLEFFETRIRPVLVEQCYQCHNSTTQTDGSFAIDSRTGLLEGGETGSVLVPGNPAKSRLLAILRHEVDGLKMPKKSGKLDPGVIADFEKWIAMGAPDPRDHAPTAKELERATSWGATLEKRRHWWSFQPIRNPAPPQVYGAWSDHPVDRFVQAKLEEKGLEPGAPADARTLVRRLFLTLIGLPPTATEVEHWTGRLASPAGYEELVDHLLASPHFGERWARHWMDWIRYAESHGSEGDPAIDNAWVYRDYLIRALNADVSYDQLVREHVAGDLLEQPRINAKLGINESIIGPAHFRMVFHGFAPTDALEEKVRFIDDEVNTFSKAFLGLTVSCARCHDHKFDPISQRDYYALFGVLASCRPGRAAIDTPDRLNLNRDRLIALKPRIRSAIASDWLSAMGGVKARLLASDDKSLKLAEDPTSLTNLLLQQRKETTTPAEFSGAWNRRVDAWRQEAKRSEDSEARQALQRWNLANKADYAAWFHQGTGLTDGPSAAGEFSVAAEGDQALTGIYPAGVYSHALSSKHAARLSSGYVRLADTYDLWVRAIGQGGSTARYVVQDYPRSGVIYPEIKLGGQWKWQQVSMAYWNGDEIHVELTTSKDAPVLVGKEDRSWFGVRDVMIVKKGEAPPVERRGYLDPIFEASAKKSPGSLEDLADCYITAITQAIAAWQAGSATDAQAELLNACISQGLLSNRTDQLKGASDLLAEYRRLEAEIAVPTRVPALEETVARNQHLFVRGNHKQPSDEVERRFLEVIDPAPYQGNQSGRRQLAEQLLRDDNPLTRRVIVNRLWHHLFGRGIVATPDNFGRLGILPTHPELLDYLATRFREHGGSIKEMIRFIVTSKTWQLASQPSLKAQQVDPDNLYLSHAPLRRLEAEAIRDSLVAVSGSLNDELFGPPVDGRSPRRGIYVAVRRTALDPFLRSFDFPEPFSATGRRDVTNVPAQSLMLMNDDYVASLAATWAAHVLADGSLASDEARIQAMFDAALARPATAQEVEQIKQYLAGSRQRGAAVAAHVTEIRGQIEQERSAITAIVEPVRLRLLGNDKPMPAGQVSGPTPIARWDFKADLHDVIGTMHGQVRSQGGARMASTKGFVISAPLTKTLREKTLEAWVQLDNLEQRGGGVMSLMTPNGAVFDAIVFAEKDAGQWMAGSNFFKRTQSLGGPIEREATARPVHLAMAYHADGMIAAYRDGKPYGTAYKTDGPVEFKVGEAVVGFGIRHLPGKGNAFLSGQILRAQLYDRALTAEEVARSAQSSMTFISDDAVNAALSEADRQRVAHGRENIAALDAQLAKFGPAPAEVDEKLPWTDLARAMFMFKEFIYLR